MPRPSLTTAAPAFALAALLGVAGFGNTGCNQNQDVPANEAPESSENSTSETPAPPQEGLYENIVSSHEERLQQEERVQRHLEEAKKDFIHFIELMDGTEFKKFRDAGVPLYFRAFRSHRQIFNISNMTAEERLEAVKIDESNLEDAVSGEIYGAIFRPVRNPREGENPIFIESKDWESIDFGAGVLIHNDGLAVFDAEKMTDKIKRIVEDVLDDEDYELLNANNQNNLANSPPPEAIP